MLSRFRVATQSRLNIDSETTEKRLEIDSLGGGGRWWWGMNPGGWAVAENTISLQLTDSQQKLRDNQLTENSFHWNISLVTRSA